MNASSESGLCALTISCGADVIEKGGAILSLQGLGGSGEEENRKGQNGGIKRRKRPAARINELKKPQSLPQICVRNATCILALSEARQLFSTASVCSERPLPLSSW